MAASPKLVECPKCGHTFELSAMARKPKIGNSHSFRNKLLLNQWVISLFGIDPLAEHKVGNKKVRPFHLLADPIRNRKIEGLDHDNLHHFYHELVRSDLFWNDFSRITKEQLLVYEQNISRHTQVINEKRERSIHWKYFQWLTLLFTEIYLDRYFSDQDRLLKDLNDYVARFNAKWPAYADVLPFQRDDLNKVCLQNATGSGKTLLMHVNVLQFEHYAKLHGKTKDIARTILITPNERLSRQHIDEFAESSLSAISYQQAQGGLFGAAKGLERVDVLEITKLQDQQGPNTVATRSLGDTNLLLVDEGHRGISGQNAKKEESAWFKRRAMLSERDSPSSIRPPLSRPCPEPATRTTTPRWCCSTTPTDGFTRTASGRITRSTTFPHRTRPRSRG